MPHRVTKKPSTTTSSAPKARRNTSTTSNGNPRRESQHTEDNPRSSPHLSSDAEVIEVDKATQSTSQRSASAGAGEEQALKIISDIMEAQKKRHEIASTSIHNSYAAAVIDAKWDITTLFEDHEKQAAKAHQTQLAHLQNLLAQKAKIEVEMRKRVAKLRDVYRAHAMDLQRVFEGRAAQLE